MPAVIVKSYNNYTAWGASLAVTIDAPTSGNSLITVYSTATGGSPAVTDNGSGSPTHTEDAAYAQWSGSNMHHYVARRHNVTNSPTTVTITRTGDSEIAMSVYEVSGLAQAGPEVQNHNQVASTDSPTVSVTTTSAECFGVGKIGQSGSRSYTPGGTGTWVIYPNTQPAWDSSWHQVNMGTAGTETLAATLDSGGVNTASTLVAYALASAGGESEHLRRGIGRGILRGV